MVRKELSDWLQLFASIATLAGIFLVLLELRQNNELARAATINNIYEGWEDFAMSDYETGKQDLLIKSIEEPENLSSAEIIQLSSWYEALLAIYARQSVMFTEYGLADDPEDDLVDEVNRYFLSRFGRSWYVENQVWMEPRMAEIIRRELAANPVETESSYVERIRSRLQD